MKLWVSLCLSCVLWTHYLCGSDLSWSHSQAVYDVLAQILCTHPTKWPVKHNGLVCVIHNSTVPGGSLDGRTTHHVMQWWGHSEGRSKSAARQHGNAMINSCLQGSEHCHINVMTLSDMYEIKQPNHSTTSCSTLEHLHTVFRKLSAPPHHQHQPKHHITMHTHDSNRVTTTTQLVMSHMYRLFRYYT